MSAALDPFLGRGAVGAVPPAVAPARAFPSVAVLCAPARSRPVGASIALALARAIGAPCVLVAAVGMVDQAAGALAVTPAARRAANRLYEAGYGATPRGRLVWLAERRREVAEGAGRPPGAGEPDRAEGPLAADADERGERAAALCAEVARAAALLGVPAVTVLPLPRTAALDRLIAWHEAVVAVPEPNANRALAELGLASIASLGVASACVDPPTRIAGSLALLGFTPPASATAALARLDLRR